MGKKDVLHICAHADDQVLGAGGTIAKLASEGKNIHTIIFSYGELIHPHLKIEALRKEKEKETKKANDTLGVKSVKFLKVKEGRISQELKKGKAKKELEKVLKEYKPSKIFTHVPEDPHPDHRAVSKAVIQNVKELKLDCEVYGFERWSLFHLKRRNYPRAIIDITPSMKKKMEALGNISGQMLTMGWKKFIVYTKALIIGITHDTKYAETFYRLH